MFVSLLGGMDKVNRGVPDSKPETSGLKSHSKGVLRRGSLGPYGVVLASLCCPRVARLGIAGSGGFGRGRELVPPTSDSQTPSRPTRGGWGEFKTVCVALRLRLLKEGTGGLRPQNRGDVVNF